MGFFVLEHAEWAVGPLFVWGGDMRQMDPVLKERLETLIASMGYELLGCECLSQGRQMVFRIYMDGKNAVTIDDCSRVSRQVSAMLDVEEVFQGRYFLEVSSPGINRPLFELEHYRRAIGRTVKIRLHALVNERRQFAGVLLRVEGEDIYLQVEGLMQEVRVPFSVIEKGHVVGEV